MSDTYRWPPKPENNFTPKVITTFDIPQSNTPAKTIHYAAILNEAKAISLPILTAKI
jgi:hypothetical protein